MVELVELIDEALSVKTRDEWGPIFDEHGLIWGPVLGLHEVVADPQAEAMGLFPTITHPESGDYRTRAVADPPPRRRHRPDQAVARARRAQSFGTRRCRVGAERDRCADR